MAKLTVRPDRTTVAHSIIWNIAQFHDALHESERWFFSAAKRELAQNRKHETEQNLARALEALPEAKARRK